MAIMAYDLWDCVATIPPIHTTLENTVMVVTLHQLFPTQTASSSMYFVSHQCNQGSLHTQASFNTMQYKGRDSASGIDRKLSIIRPGATTIVAP
jgi:hypothetical protein